MYKRQALEVYHQQKSMGFLYKLFFYYLVLLQSRQEMLLYNSNRDATRRV